MHTVSKWQDDDIVALVDIGSHRIVVLIVKMLYTEQKIEIIASDTKGIGIFLTQSDSLEDSALVGMIYAMEEKYNIQVKNIAVSISNGHLKFYNIQCGFRFDYPILINPNHIIKMEKHCLQKKTLDTKETIIDLFNNYYSVDMGISVSDPVNVNTSSIKGNYSLIYANRGIIDKIYKYISQNKLDIVSFISTAQATSLVVLKKEEKNNLCAVILLGASDVSISIIKNGHTIKIHHIATGGNSITNNIIKIFGVSSKDAEAMKIAASSVHTNEDIILSKDYFPSLPRNQTIKISDVREIVYKNTKAIFLKINEYFTENLKSQIPSSIILTGGMANMSNIEELANIVLKTNCRIGTLSDKVWIISNNKEINKIFKNPAFTTVLGMSKYLLTRYKQHNLTKSNNWLWNRFYKITSFIEDFFY